MEKIIIFDLGVPTGGENKIFDRAFAYKISHTLLPICYLSEEAKKVGIQCVTPDVFLKDPEEFKMKEVLLLSHLITPETKKLIELGAKPFLLLCQESPFIATKFYLNLKKYTGMFAYSMLFPGMEKRIDKKTKFIPMFFPQFFSDEAFVPLTFQEKKFTTYIASNKETKNLIKLFAIRSMYGLSINLIYSFRRKIINFLSHRGDFDLYGKGWGGEKPSYIKKVYKGPVDDKEKKLREYKFVLCLENAAFPGYVTEKIFDSFFAGSVPVYLGAPDINMYVPENTFVNIDDFKNLNELERYMDSIDEEAYNTYIENIHSFLHSPGYEKFSHQYFAKSVLNLIEAYTS
jgi:hypothetical protein